MPFVDVVHVHLRDVETLDDVADVTAPVEPGDLVATAHSVYAIEVVPDATDGLVVPVLARRVDATSG